MADWPLPSNGVRADAVEEGHLGPRRPVDAAGKRAPQGPKWTREPQLGDLVLAKVKGYPFWPAKVSRPEDWNQEPAPRKFFVVFLGTKEIAFVGLQDLLPFTEKVKQDLVNKAREKRFPERHVKGLEVTLVEVLKAYDELPKSSETANGLLPDPTPDQIAKPTEPLAKRHADSGTPKLEQIDDFHGRYPSLKRKDRDVPKSSETANGLLHYRTPDPIEKPVEPLVKQPVDGGTPKLGQTDDSHGRYLSLKREQRVLFAGIEERNLEDPYGIPKCIAVLEGLPDLQMEDTLKAADLFTDSKGNREVFLSFSSNALRLGWVRRKIQNT
ncbi:protein HUA2-LIKE 1-like isoform X1 [Hordeum vulgare subsp. vulgare]|uniref:PWWP domain-containing protein n=1 Tax=Hordeum vulgare subsp. vulgare TaxID=112509 RepID=A0A8I6Z431_HORVV|nr:protein HUA2-LIKE 1-like isoform X1 [Hordeum vulgare subsp. vulgare]